MPRTSAYGWRASRQNSRTSEAARYGILGRMKTTIEIPDELFKRAETTAALEGESLRELICEALETRLAATAPTTNDQSGWRSVFGLADPKAVAEVDEVIEREFEQVNPAEWR